MADGVFQLSGWRGAMSPIGHPLGRLLELDRKVNWTSLSQGIADPIDVLVMAT